MNKEILDLAIQFLERVNLNGKEVPAYTAVINSLYMEKQKLEEQEDGASTGSGVQQPSE